MNTNQMTNDEIRQKGMEALSSALGPAGLIRFLQMFGRGSGDWTHEREQMLAGDDVRSIAERIQRTSTMVPNPDSSEP